MTGSVVVAGGGLVGLACAWELCRRGVAVTVLERHRVGGGASRGNAGLVCPALADPLPSPAALREGLTGLASPRSPLFVHPAALRQLAPFLLRFARHSTPGRHRRGLAALEAMRRETFPLFDELIGSGTVGEMASAGYLLVHGSVRAARRHRDRLGRAAAAGLAAAPGPLLVGDALRAAEPSLAPSAEAGFELPGERWVDPSDLVDSLARALAAGGATIVEGAEALAVREEADGVVVETPAGTHRAEAALLAAGVWSGPLAAALGTPLGMAPGKGYSVSVHARIGLTRPLYLLEPHVVVTPLAGRLRLAGTMEFDGLPSRMRTGRVRALLAAAERYVPGLAGAPTADHWVAPRPMTPDGLPLIGRLPGRSRVFVATGHNMLGLTLAPSTARAVADLISGRSGLDLAPFAPGRFAGWRGRG